MTEQAVAVVAITNVTFDGRRYRPGAVFELPAPCAHALESAGSVRYAGTGRPGDAGGAGAGATPPPAPPATPPPEPPAPERDNPDDEGAAGAAEPAAPDPPDPAPAVAPAPDRRPGRSHADTGGLALETVSGIGPTTAERLRLAGIADVAELATVDDSELGELRIRASLRDRARTLAGD